MPEGKSNEHDRGPYIRVRSGKLVYLNDPQPEDFDPETIAYHLAGINRYTGGSRFTVAQHCVVASEMAKLFYPGETFLPARMLIHDADEAFYGDVSSPLKSLLGDYRYLEEKAQLAVEQRFDMLFIGDALVKECDYRMWLSEREYGVSLGGLGNNDYRGPLVPFTGNNRTVDHEVVWDMFQQWPASVAETRYVESVRRLFPWLQ